MIYGLLIKLMSCNYMWLHYTTVRSDAKTR